MEAIMTCFHTHAHTDFHLLGKSLDKAGSTLTQSRVKNLRPNFFHRRFRLYEVLSGQSSQLVQIN